MLSNDECNQLEEVLNRVLKIPKAVVKLDFEAKEACSSCGLSIEESKLISSRNNGEVVVVPMDLFRDMLDNVKDTSVWEHAVKLLVPV